MTEGYARYDYAWKTAGWTVQNPGWIEGLDSYTDPGLPEDVSKVRIFGNFKEWSTGRALEGVLQIRATKILTYVPDNVQVMPGVKRFRFKHGGFSVLIPATDDPQLTPNGFRYQARLTVRGITQEFDFDLPSIPTEVNITSLISAEGLSRFLGDGIGPTDSIQ